MKTVNLYFDFEFTSLSPDAQPISLGIVADEFNIDKAQFELQEGIISMEQFLKLTQMNPSSFYAEFSDFDINRCDDWVKDNVVKKLQFQGPITDELVRSLGKNYIINLNTNKGDTDYNVLQCPCDNPDDLRVIHDDNPIGIGPLKGISDLLRRWLDQFSDYQIQFICDCGTWDWYWLVQLLAEWEEKENVFEYDPTKLPGRIPVGYDPFIGRYVRTGLPKLPENISPVPSDLNDLIAIKKGITPKQAFDLNREELAFGGLYIVPDTTIPDGMSIDDFIKEWKNTSGVIIQLKEEPKVEIIVPGENYKHNALFDAKVIKEIYQKLK